MNESNNQSEPQNKKVIRVEKTEMFAGPVPHPEIVEKYEKIYPGAAKKIFDEWENQVKHRHHIEKSIVWTDNIKSILGVIFGFVAVGGAIGCGAYTALKGHPLFGGGLSLAGLAMLAVAFLTSRKPDE